MAWSSPRVDTKPFVRVFWNSDERRLRALWRLLGCAGLLAVVMVLAGLSAALWERSRLGQYHVAVTLLNALASLLVLGGLWMATRWLDRRPFADLGFHLNRAWRTDFAFGAAVGALLMAGVFLVEAVAGWIEVRRAEGLADGRAWVLVLTAQLSLCGSLGLVEEAVTRGYLLRNLAEGLRGRRLRPQAALALAWVGSSVVFGLYHALNPGATFLSTLNLVAAGLFLGLPYVLTGSLAMPIGLHVAWNFFQGPVFGFPVSGVMLGASLLEVSQVGPDLWTGGRFGPEGGLLGLAFLWIGACLVLWWVQGGRGLVALQNTLAEYQLRSTEETIQDQSLESSADSHAPTPESSAAGERPPGLRAGERNLP